MPSVQAVQKITRTVVIPIADEKLTVTYPLSAMNSSLEDAVSKGILLTEWIERVVTSWDLTDNGEPVPLTAEALNNQQMALPLLKVIQTAVILDSDWRNLRESWGKAAKEGV